MKITKQDLDEDNFYKEDGIDTDEDIETEEDLGYIKLRNPRKLNPFWKSKIFEKLREFKIVRIIVNRFDLGKWRIENFQRNGIIYGLNGCNPEDIIIVSDLDEIPNPKCIGKVKKNISLGERIGLEQNLFFFYINGLAMGKKWVGSKIVTYETLEKKLKKRPQKIKIRKNFLLSISNRDVRVVKDGGWHFTYLGGEKAIKRKLRSTAEIGKIKITKERKGYKFIPREFYGGKNSIKIRYISPKSKLLPIEIRKNYKKYEKLLFNTKLERIKKA